MEFLNVDENDTLKTSSMVVVRNADTGDSLWAQCMQAVSVLRCWPFREHEAKAQRLGGLAFESDNDWKARKGECKSTYHYLLVL